jgi:fermentation-respiration switch protein FrsA (DUF1100 family)
MVRLEWNALRVGDKVLVHDPTDPAIQLRPGVVAMVQTVKGSNDIGVSVARESDRSGVLRPRRLAVHLDPLDPAEECWRCDAIVAETARPLEAAVAIAP